MKLHSILLTSLLGLTAQAYACSNPVKDIAVKQDINSLHALGQQYHITGKAVADAWQREAGAKQQGNLVAMAVATEQLALYRFELNAIKSALTSAKVKLSADIKIAAKSPCPTDSVED